ncbi:MAG: transporter substrate-binding domain-containing protein [Solobacterium sp.]|nr:transporter substrate-binding domain-containing protein [Solobacterium sp.]
MDIDHLSRIKESGKLVIGLEGVWQPFCYHDAATDELIGFDVEVSRNIAERIGVEVEFKEGAWEGLFMGLDAGQYDLVVNGVDVTEDRKAAYNFSDPYLFDNTVLVVRADNNEIKSFEDLKGKKTANSTGSTYAEIGAEYGAEVSGVSDLAKTIQMVLNGQVDATINASLSIVDYQITTGETNIKVVAELPSETGYAIPMVKGKDNDTLRAAINDALKSMREDGTLKELSIKYFGSDLTEIK